MPCDDMISIKILGWTLWTLTGDQVVKMFIQNRFITFLCQSTNTTTPQIITTFTTQITKKREALEGQFNDFPKC